MTVEYRGLVRARDGDTSWSSAAKQTVAKTEAIKAVIIGLFAARGPMTDEQLVGFFEKLCDENPSFPRCTPQSVRTRRKALVLQDLVRDSGKRGVTRLGNTATIWEAVTAPATKELPAAAPTAPGEEPHPTIK